MYNFECLEIAENSDLVILTGSTKLLPAQ